MAIEVFRLGYSVGGKIVLNTNPFYPIDSGWSEGTGDIVLNVLMTAGEIAVSRSPIFQNMASIGAIDDHGSRIKTFLSDGVVSNNGSISFDCDKKYVTSFLSWVFTKRKESFTVYIGTENFSYVKVPSCRWSSISITSAEGSVLKVSISFSSNVLAEEVNRPPEQIEFEEIYKTSEMIPYWETGFLSDTDVLNVASWDLSISQNLIPQYLNIPNFDLPAYFRTGHWDFNMNVQMVAQISDYNKIYFGVNDLLSPLVMNLEGGIRTNASISFGGLESMGGYQVSTTLVGKPEDYLDNASTQTPFTLSFA